MFNLKDKENYNEREHYLDLLSRLTHFDTDVVEEYVRINKLKLNSLTISKIYTEKFLMGLYYTERSIKLKKLLKNIDK